MRVHQLAAFQAKHGAAQDLVGLGIDDDLHEAARLAGFLSTSYLSHRQFRHAELASLGSSPLFAQAHPSQLGIDEDRRGDEATLGAGVALFKQVLRKSS